MLSCINVIKKIMRYKIQNALILKQSNFRENDLKITLLNQNGKHELLAKGGKNINSKLVPMLLPLSFCDLWIIKSKYLSLDIIADVKIRNNFFENLRKSPLHLKFSLRAIEILDNISYPEISSGSLLKNLLKLLLTLPKIKEIDLPKLWIHFELFVLEYLGLKPSKLPKMSIKKLSKYLEEKILNS
ncbi:MAG: hypothetical protein UR15_C0005G0003 [Parcubacteria group bacterium GW2011_GWA2_31_28]|nr:MAG: hypothetical protein UR15_C0005G0003 [Parcubacteria group bacterium GW2011_GWA2_31_28]